MSGMAFHPLVKNRQLLGRMKPMLSRFHNRQIRMETRAKGIRNAPFRQMVFPGIQDRGWRIPLQNRMLSGVFEILP